VVWQRFDDLAIDGSVNGIAALVRVECGAPCPDRVR
jgi:hypothetical protein